MSQVNLMLDLETLGTEPGSVILSIAAVPFACEDGKHREDFYERLSFDSCKEAGLTTSPDTIAWWQSQSAAAREAAFGGTTQLSTALYSFVDYLSHLDGEVFIWGNGSDFDLPMLHAAYTRSGFAVVPWNFRNIRCYRTLRNLFPYVKGEELPGQIKHHALWDARYQAAHATALLNWSYRCQHI